MSRILGRAARNAERGSAMLITLILVAALLAGGAVLVAMQVSSNKGTEVTRTGVTALHCAEAGLASARTLVANNFADWDGTVSGTNWLSVGAACNPITTACEPSWLAAMNHDLDGGGAAVDFVITLKDNDDEQTGPNDPSTNSDLSVFVVSTCLMYPDNTKQISELVTYTGGGQCYNNQKGGCFSNSNQ